MKNVLDIDFLLDNISRYCKIVIDILNNGVVWLWLVSTTVCEVVLSVQQATTRQHGVISRKF